MKNIVSHIQCLLTQHDCVIVPGWGALVVQHCNAVIENGTMLPPRRWLSFNPLLKHNDAMLAHSLMCEAKCSYDEAMLMINKQVSEWCDALTNDGAVVWQGVGRYESQSGSTLLFAEDANSVVQAPFSTFQPLELTTLADVATAQADDESVEEEWVEVRTPMRWYHRVGAAVASVAAIAILLLLVSTPVDNIQPTNDYAALVSAELLGVGKPVADESHSPVTEGITEDTMPLQVEVVDNVVVADDIVAEAVAEQSAVMPVERNVVAGSEYLPRYILVIGSLSSYEGAEQQIAQFHREGVTDEIGIYESNGKYRLYIEGYNSIQQAQQRVDEITAQPQGTISGVWICSTK